MRPYFCNATPISAPEDIIPFLLAKEMHWRADRSAYELAHCWMGVDGIPPAVATVLSSRPELTGAQLIEGHFERSTPTPGRGKASQTDLLALCAIEEDPLVLAVEGKVDETLGPLVSDWDNGTPNRRERLRGLLELLELEEDRARPLRYQLIHRTAAALIEAKRFGAEAGDDAHSLLQPDACLVRRFCGLHRSPRGALP